MRSEEDMAALQNKLINKIHQLNRQLAKLPRHGERRRFLERVIEVMEIESKVLKWMTWDKGYKIQISSRELEKKIKKIFK